MLSTQDKEKQPTLTAETQEQKELVSYSGRKLLDETTTISIAS